MRKRSLPLKWFTAVLAAGLILFAAGCTEDDDDPDNNDPGIDPNAPALSSPVNNANVDLDELADADEELYFRWAAVTGAVSYEIQIAASNTFAASAMIDEEQVDTTLFEAQVNKFIIDARHYWRVRAIMNESGSDMTGWSAVRTFTPVAQPILVTEILSGDITSNKTLTRGTGQTPNTYLLRGGVFVTSGATLTIEAGVTVYGEAATDGMLVIAQGARIQAVGTREAPIIFTSDRPVGSRGRGDWGGVILNGRAPLNTGTQAFGEGDTGPYGGTNPTDNSGTMRYCRIEFAGREISPDNELNGLALQGVGSGTIIEYIQIHMNQDDGIEFFGGTVNARYIYVTGAADDSFDWTDGWAGKGQFWVCQQYPDDANRGFESDNNAENNSATPFSNPTIYNFTLVGAAAGDRGMLLREGTKGKMYNGIVMNFTEYGIRIDGTQAQANFTAGDLAVRNTIFHNDVNYHSSAEAAVTDPQYMNDQGDPGLTSPLNLTSPNFVPVSDGLATTKAAAQPSDSWFEQVDFIGGVDPDDNWIAGWTTSAQN